MSRFKATVFGNEVLEGEGFFISYNARPFGRVGLFQSDDSSETVLVLIHTQHDPDQYLVLHGDFRSEYEAVIEQGLEACKGVYEAHKATRNSSLTTKKRG